MTFWMGSAPRARNTAARFSMTTALTACALVGITAFGSTEAQARITRIEIKRVEQPTFQGRTFGAVGAYEKLLGRAFGEVDPKDPRNAVIASLMVDSKRETWHDTVKRSEDAGADGLELNFGCPHGMSERGMGSAVGQVPDYTCMIT